MWKDGLLIAVKYFNWYVCSGWISEYVLHHCFWTFIETKWKLINISKQLIIPVFTEMNQQLQFARLSDVKKTFALMIPGYQYLII